MLPVEKNYNSGLWDGKYLVYKVYIKNPLDYNASYVVLFYMHVLFWCFTCGKKIQFHFLTCIAKTNANCLNHYMG